MMSTLQEVNVKPKTPKDTPIHPVYLQLQDEMKRIMELKHKLTECESQCIKQIRAVLRKYCHLLEKISFLLPPDVHRLIHSIATMVNQSLLVNRRKVARLLLLLLTPAKPVSSMTSRWVEIQVIDRSTQVENQVIDRSTQEENQVIDRSTQVENHVIDRSTQEENQVIDRSTQVENQVIERSTQEENQVIDRSTQEENQVIDRSTQEENQVIDRSTQVQNQVIDRSTQDCSECCVLLFYSDMMEQNLISEHR
ncbi:uncharacterized protein LOC117767749 isoform X2 [Hippoglossus hippoglossus]|uniref:uncharacterized protein LOC117767749 isoform X2 n=1 Tax=Hippoglossus hippoglossus TaxID=8267 RepID=UPI00148C3CBA|nr:uncharacterized protein LOC117767749 isoform X2 [Hippoglossus hippoglossus]